MTVTAAHREVETPRGRDLASLWARVFHDPLGMYERAFRGYGDTVRMPFTRRRAFYLLSRPEYAEHVLVAHQDRYVKAFTYKPLKAFLGDGLLTSEGETWQRHRRLVQPVFNARHLGQFAPQMIAAAQRRVASWPVGQSVDAGAEMRTLTMDVVGRVLFGTDLADAAARTGEAVSKLQDAVVLASLFPTSSAERTRSVATKIPGVGGAVRALEGLVARIIAERMRAPHGEPSDLLDLIIAAGGDERPFTAQEIRDEVMTLVLAGHETTAHTLTWSLVLLSRYPAARERLEAEVAGIALDADAPQKLVWTRAVIEEALRLYPPAWTIERDAVVDDDVAGVPVTAGCTIAIAPYLLHRNADFWPNPEGFDPGRFLPGVGEGRPRYAYLPFGGGRRICVGAGFAMLEATLALATIAARHSLDLVPGVPVVPKAGVTLRPDGPVLMTVRSR